MFNNDIANYTKSVTVGLLVLASSILGACAITPTVPSKDSTSSLLSATNSCKGYEPAISTGEHVDCIFDGGYAYTWLDDNGNGIRDVGERALSNVRISIDDTLNNYSDIGGRRISNLQGKTSLSIWLPGCPNISLEVHAEIPEGYRLTTQDRVNMCEKSDRELIEFGFTYLSGVPTATPRPTKPIECESYPLPEEIYQVHNLALTSNGEVWGIFGNVFRFNPNTHQWKIYTPQTDLPISGINSIIVDANDMVWLGSTFEGAASFNGSAWTNYSVNDGLVSNKAVSMVATPDNDIWFVSDIGASKFEPATNQFIAYPIEDTLYPKNYLEHATATSDGSLWTVNIDYISQLNLSDKEAKWIVYPIPNEYNQYGTLGIFSIAASAEDTLWLGGRNGLTHFEPEKDVWTLYDYETTNGAMLGYISSFAIASDGSIWLGTWENGVLQLITSSDGIPSNALIVYYTKDILIENGEISTTAVSSDGTIWFGTVGSLIQCRIENN